VIADEEGSEPTDQSTALRRQQRSVAAAGAAIAALAVTVSIVQRFPEYAAVAVLAGLLSGGFLYRLASNSVFPGEGSDEREAGPFLSGTTYAAV